MTSRALPVLLTAALLALHAPARADDADAQKWLERMSMAAHSLNYTGTFVYQHQGQLEAMQIVHAMDEEGERERLMSLTGPKREVLRDNQVVICILGDRQAVHVNNSRPRVAFPVGFPTELMQLEELYSFEVQGEDRVAGHPCRLVAVKPYDSLRYGRRLCVHEVSHLLLRSELTAPDGRPIEQVMFTNVNFPERIDEADLLPSLSSTDYSWKREPEQSLEPGDSNVDSRWKLFQVPKGFILTDHSWHQLELDEPGVEHWVYSDGLASISVYIEEARSDEKYGGMSHRGALNAYGTMVAGHYVTVVGEVPRETVEMVGRSVRIK